jgi:death on curing protein
LPRGKSQLYRLWPAFIENAHDFGIGIVWPGIEPVGEATCLDLNLLRSTAEQPYQECFGRELYPTLAAKAAYLFVHLAGGHIFSNGNKRTAVLCLDTFLMANSRYLVLTNEEARELAVWVASAGERGDKFEKVFETVREAVEASTVALNALRKIDLEQYRYAIHQKNWIRTDPHNQPNAPLSQKR